MNPVPFGSAKDVRSSRWAHTKWVFLQVCDLDPEACRQRLDELCGDNQQERQEVERLLLHDSPESIFDDLSSEGGPASAEAGAPFSPVSDDVRDPRIGRTVLGYRLLNLIGRGGMGEVYRAEDTRLKRLVAVKFLSSRFVHDERQKRRFLHEAQAAASLDHPSICPVYDVGEFDGYPYIVAALIEGKNLAEVMRAGDFPVAAALDCAIQIADGLEAAHLQGIVHRDMKPGNVILAPDSDRGVHARIIDFGLARIIGSTHLTERHGLLGTAAYIAPEILEGQEVDPRADIWSLGVMLYEMLAGRPPFDADHRERLFYEICNEEAEPLTAVRPNVPEEAARIVAKALEKDRNLRYQHASEIGADLRRLKRELESSEGVTAPLTAGEPVFAPAGSAASAVRPKAPSGTIAASTFPAQPETTGASGSGLWNVGVMVLAGILVGLGIVSWYVWRQTAPEPETSRRQLTSNSSEVPVTAAAISPDGKYLAYADDTGIYVRVLATGERHPLADISSGFATSTLSWFPDGIRVVASGMATAEMTPSIWVVSILGGAPRKLRDDARGASVSPDGSQIAFLNRNATEIWLMGGSSEDPHRFVAADEGDRLAGLGWFPDSDRLGYLQRGIGARRPDVNVMSRDLRESQSRTVFANPGLVAFHIVSDGRMLMSLSDTAVNGRGFDLWEIGINLRNGQASSEPRRLTNWGSSVLAGLSVTADGKRLAYLDGTAQYDTYVAELAGDGLSLKPPRRLTLDDSLNVPGTWTPDGKEILFTSDRNGSLDIFRQAIDQRTAEAIVAGPQDECDPTMSPDGAWVLYMNLPLHRRLTSTGPVTLRRVPLPGGPSQVVLSERGFCCVDCTGSKAGAKLCTMDKRVGDELIFYAFDPVRGMGRELTRIHNPVQHFWRVSPDGSSIAFATPEGGGGMRILSLIGKPARDILLKEAVDHFIWSDDGMGFYAVTMDTNGVPEAISGGSLQKLLHVDLDGRTRTLWQSGYFSGVYSLPSPDGRSLALGMGRMVGNAWMIENF